MTASRFVVGIDLGTTNSGVAYVDTGAAEPAAGRSSDLPVPQVVGPGSVADRPLLPSYLYLPGPGEVPAGSLKLPWDANRDYAVGEFARQQGSLVPTRLVSSAKSWLCHPGIDRKGPVLPWKGPEGGRRVSPLEASTLYLKHLVEAWNYQLARDLPDRRLEQQDVILTVPASFDAAARELTVEAARAAGLENVTLLEEPQAAFYAWIEANGEAWRKLVKVGDAVLICDVGGGTTDLTLIAVGEESGRLELTRVAVGEHLLIGGDNMDLALAHAAARAFTERKIKLDSGQMLQLWHSARASKERLFTEEALKSAPVTVLGRGSRVIAGTIQGELTREEVERVLVDGFFPECKPDAGPLRQKAVGLQELGLPYAADPAVTKHLAQFLHRHSEALAEKLPAKGKRKATAGPTAVLFNGGVLKAEPLRRRVATVLNQWAKSWGGGDVKVLPGGDLDRAVAAGPPITAWCGAARACASAAARPRRTTSAWNRRCRRFRGRRRP